ncbi:hypothetical protein [Natrinema sp. 1APR25-10V2]|uniref:hypothetical protein n=1 Tax=Natrinema sp. 1APR25-10V2 TaxID=2951081 RepID=UPI002874A7DE|nr:hypothetical protein [Natrinema sp. 1APR25-10V2]MDS0476803.1 hypothetical protein [Natrinema sp. 1APR25-10V2]
MGGRAGNGEAGQWGRENAIVVAVQDDIDHGVSVYDAVFRRQRDRFGEAFVAEYLSEVATHMAVQVVRAFEAHDRKQYARCARAFGEVYMFLCPVAATEAHAAGAGYALALKQHDVIEDGVDAVTADDPITTWYREATTDGPVRARAILEHPYWNAVLCGFELVADFLGLPNVYAVEQTEFFRYHTAAYEARDRAAVRNQELEEKAMVHAKRAQKTKFGVFIDDAKTLEAIAERYLAAVRSHDTHTMAEQETNIGRMTCVYDRVLANVVGGGAACVVSV